jgi:5-methylthioadenosine/S-adenosylhomocysteine deaminase
LEKVDLLVHGCIILPMRGQGFINDGTLAVKDGRIVLLGRSKLTTGLKAELSIDGRGKVAMPGLINCHTHAPMTLFRGVADDQPLGTWLKDTVWPLEAKLGSSDVYDGALLGCLEMVKSGTTCFADMYFNEQMIAEAAKNSGLRAVLAEGIVEAGNRESGRRMFDKSVDFARRFNGYAEGRVSTMLGPHSAYSCSQEILTMVSEASSRLGIGVHMHLAESKTLFKESEKEHGVGEVDFLDRIGFLKNGLLAAHCINLSGKDMETLSNRGVNVVHVPVANMKLGLDAAKVRNLQSLKVNVSLGTDGPASNNSLDMFETMKFAALLQKLTYHDPRVLSAYDLLKMATLNGAKALGLEKDVGSLEVGKKADIILVNLSEPHLKPLHSVYSNLVYSARGSDVDTVIVDGKILMRNRQVVTLDECAVMKKAEKTAFDLLSR